MKKARPSPRLGDAMYPRRPRLRVVKKRQPPSGDPLAAHFTEGFTRMPKWVQQARPRLGPARYAVLSAIVDLTIGWNKPYDLFALNLLASMTGLSYASVKRHVKALEAMRFVKVYRHQGYFNGIALIPPDQRLSPQHTQEDYSPGSN